MVQGITHAQGIHVSDQTPHPYVEGREWDTIAYPMAFPDNEYARMMIREGGEHVMPSLGLTASHVELLHRWVGQHRLPLIAAFDWDRTLTVVEGLILPGNSEWNGRWPWSASDTMLYLFGGIRRLHMLQDMFAWLHREGVHVFIITRNSNSVDARGAFLDLVRRLDPLFSADHLLYAGNDASKADTLRNSRSYRSISGNRLGGGRGGARGWVRRRSMSRRRRSRRARYLKTRRG